MISTDKLYGAVEGGGTKFVCAVGRGPQDIVAETRFPTTTPQETLARAVEFFRQYELAAIGLASFGPVDLNPASPSFGSITTTPKPGWGGTNVLAYFQRALGVPVVFETDVNAAAFGEYYWVEENRALDSLVYFTIGTGIGAGIVVNGQILHGLTHPEAGHMRLPHDWQRDPYPGCCPFHGDCFEGLACGVALAKRWGQAADSLPSDHPAWPLEAEYIALAMVAVICLLSPRRIILGGGIMQRTELLPLIRQRVKQLLHGYIASPIFEGDLETYLVPPALGKRSGVLGALALAQQRVDATP